MPDVFISYPRRDQHKVQIINDSLERVGLSTFFDVQGLDGGDNFRPSARITNSDRQHALFSRRE